MTIECERDQYIIENKRKPKVMEWGRQRGMMKTVTPTLCFAQVSLDRCSKHAWSDSKWQEKRSKCEWSNCFLWIPFILISGSPNEWWLHTCDACIMITWRLKLQATLVARNKVVKSDFLKNSNFGLTRYPIDLANFWYVVLEWCPKYWMHILFGFKDTGMTVLTRPRKRKF